MLVEPLTRRWALLAVAAAFALATVAVQAEARPMGDGGPVRLMTSPAGTMSFPPFVIKKFGLDKKYGFNLEIIPYTTQNAAQAALQGNGADMVVFDWIASARLRKAGVKIVGIAPFLNYVNSVIVPVNSPIKDLGDLKGKRVGISNKTGFDWIMMAAAARKLHGVDLEKVVTLQEGAVPLLRGALEQGHLDATQMWNSLAPDMIASGKFRTLVTIRELTERMGLKTAPFLFYAVREDYAKEKPQNTRAFVAAYREVVEILKTNDDVWVERGAEMKLKGEALVLFRDQVRRDILEKFTPDMSETLNETFKALLEVSNADVLGMDSMPDGMLTLEYQ